MVFSRGFLKENFFIRVIYIRFLNMKIYFVLIIVFIKKIVDFNIKNILKNFLLF